MIGSRTNAAGQRLRLWTNNGQFGNYPVMPTFSATSSFSLPSERDFSYMGHLPGARAVRISLSGRVLRFRWDKWAIPLVYRSAKSSNLIISFFFWP